ncbi:MAG: thiosulfate sulfurtransferase GlpE [Acidiferrobacterales bacterium]|nr:thiosulfate sulfurtransferase GlpE [Acidiferrobacterales bacterium]
MTFQRIDQAVALSLIDDESAVVVDIRDPASFSAGHIKNALHLTQENVGSFISSTAKSVPVIVCCYHGNSSQGAAEFLNQQGFERCYSLDGGYSEWNKAGLD